MSRSSLFRAAACATFFLLAGTAARAQFTSQHSVVYLPGNFNGYDTVNSAMRLVSNGLWQTHVFLTNYSNPQFLFSNYQFDDPPASNAFVWKETDQSQFGLPMGGVAELNSGNDISITGTVAALLRFTFNDQTLAYSVENVSYGTVPTNPWINEFHYDDSVVTESEFVELAGPAGSLNGYQLLLYNGSGGAVYRSNDLSALSIPNQQNGLGAVVIGYTNILQNGSPDGIALGRNGVLVQFLSYEGTFVGVGGVANGVTSTPVGVEESNGTSPGDSLQLIGLGSSYSNFTWAGPAGASRGAINQGQLLIAGGPSAVVTITNLVTAPTLPLTGQPVFVTANINATNGASNLSVTLFYRVGVAGNFLPIAMTNAGNAYTSVSGIPAQAAGASVYYYVFVNFAGLGPNSPTQYPAVPARYGVGTVPAGAVWINEVNPEGDAFVYGWDFEFIELAGLAGSAIGSWTVEVYSAGSSPSPVMVIPATKVLPNDYNGFGFYALGDTVGGLMNIDQVFPTFPDDILQVGGAVRLLDQFGNVRDYVYWHDPAFPSNALLYPPGGRYIGYDVDFTNGNDWVFALSGTGGTASAFTWGTNVDYDTTFATNTTPGMVNTNQYLVGGNTNPIPPLIICPSDVILACTTSKPPAANTASVTATGYCGVGTVTVTWVSDATNSGTGCRGNPKIVTRKYRAVSSCGSTSECSQLFITEDTNAPALTGPTQALANASFEEGSSFGWTEYGVTNNSVSVNIVDPRTGFFHEALNPPYNILTAAEASNNDYDGQYVNGVTRGTNPATASQGLAASFDGVDDYVNIPNPISLNGNAMTITAWIRRNGNQPDFAGLVFSRAGGTVAGLDFTAGNQLGYHWNGAANTYNWRSGIVPPDTQWCFVAFTIMTNKGEIYMRTTNAWSYAINAVDSGTEEFNGGLDIGRDSSGGRNFRGQMDDVQIYKRRLSSNEVVQLWNNGNGNIVLTNVATRWKLDDIYPGAATSGFYQDLNASSGQLWNASVWAKMSAANPLKGTNEVSVAVQFVSASNTILSTSVSSNRITLFSSTNQHIRLIARGTAPAGTTKARLRVQYQQDGVGSQGTVNVDDAQLSDTVVVAGSGIGACAKMPNFLTNGLVTATDPCGAVTLTQSPLANATLQSNVVATVTARDGCGNTSQVTFDVLVDDLTPPQFFFLTPQAIITNCLGTLPTTTYSVVDNCLQGWTVEHIGSVTNDANACLVYTNQLSGTNLIPIVITNSYVITNFYTATDLGGNIKATQQVVTVLDTAAPSSVCVPPALVNGTFETGSFGTNWQTFGVNTQVLSLSPRSGTYHAKLSGETNGAVNYTGFYQDLPTEPGDVWRLGAWVATPTNEVISVGNYLEAKIEFLDGSEAIMDTYSTRLFTNGMVTHGLYHQLHVTASPIVGATKARATVVYVQQNNGPGAVFIDEVTLARNMLSATNVYSGEYYSGLSTLTGTLACAAYMTDVTNIPVAVDCHLTSVTQIPTRATALALGTNTVRLPVRDECGNATTSTMTLLVVDVTQPTILSGPADVTVTKASLIPVPNIASVVATDSCSAVTVTNLPDRSNGGAATPENPLILVRRYLARDTWGNVTNFDQTITVVTNTTVTGIGISLGTNITVRTPGTNTWGVSAEYATNLIGTQSWLPVTNANNVFSNGTNVITFVLPTNTLPAFFRVKQTQQP